MPAIRHNILSVGHLDEAGSLIITGNGYINLLDYQGHVFAKGQQINAIYYLNAEAIVPHLLCLAQVGMNVDSRLV